MEKLEKVIAGLSCCGEANDTVNVCPATCPYYGERDGDKVCMDFLMEDALAVIEALRAERDDLRKDVTVLTELLEKADSSLRALRAWREMSEPVVHAHWVYKNGCWFCSHCDGEMLYEIEEYGGGMFHDVNNVWPPRCPYCGAHMDEEVAHE